MPKALVVGASRGLGRAIAEDLLGRGWDVTATVRDRSVLAGADRLTVEAVDTTDWAGVDALRGRIAVGSLDLLFVNAAIIGPSTVPIGEVDPQAFAEMTMVNVLAPLRIADRFADRVTPKGTIAAMSSSLGSIGLNGSGGYEAYRTSKAALNMGLASIAARRNDGRTYLAVDPGWVRTDMGGPEATLSIEESIPSLVTTLEQRAGRGGIAFVNYRGEDLPW
ncbi:SDR family NAD(P)-dependent oxidoreductase [Sphingomonas sp. ID0503]|uniref:SDR family NAD(P)-dependent oxidoreductase n=1 Tax=Sphingomonas sp. ID0503 TaxID=3399691 RepID=UPI003AFAA4F6